MTNKKTLFGLKLIYDAPATLSFAFICVVLFAADSFIFKGNLTLHYLTSPTAAKGASPFVASSVLSYLKLIIYAFGASSFSVLTCNMIFVLLLGPAMEERYGTVVIAIMLVVSVLFSGVLNACFSKMSLVGCSSVIFMMIFLNSFVSLSKKKIPVSFLFVFVLFILREIFDTGSSNIVMIIINVAGGLCGSLFAFLTSPKAKAAKKNGDVAGGLLNRASSYAEEKTPKKSFFGRKTKEEDSSSGDETVISSMKFDD